MAERIAPSSGDAVAAALADAAAQRRPVRIRGAGTKLGWDLAAPATGTATATATATTTTTSGPDSALELSTLALTGVERHRPGDGVAVVSAGTSLDALQTALAQQGQMLALDPPLGEFATLGGIFATGDSGPLRHRFGTPRDQILAVAVALADGTVARSGAGVLRNTAGYDLARLFCASFGTLGVILSLTVRLEPLPERTATALASASDPACVAAAVTALATSGLELRALDVAWRGGRGGVLAQVCARDARRRAGRVAAAMGSAGLDGVDVIDDDTALWDRQRAGQRAATGALVRINSQPSKLAELLGLADRVEATLVGRAAHGLSYVRLHPDRLTELHRGLPAGAHGRLLDHPRTSPVWPSDPGPVAALMRAVKSQFDPAGICNPALDVATL